jgi:hypothetical protein
MARLYADENYDDRVVEELRKLGHDVLTASEAGQARQRISDALVLAFAISQTRAVITFDRRHFIRLHQQVQTHSGIIVCTDDRDCIALAARVHQAIGALPSLDNQLLRINRPAKP